MVRVLITLSDPNDEDRGATLRVRSLVKKLKVEEIIVITWFKSGNVQTPDGIKVIYYPFAFGDILFLFYLFSGTPLQTILSQRRALNNILDYSDYVVFHLVRSFQLSAVKKRNKLSSYDVDICESLSENYRLRSTSLNFFKLRKYIFILEAYLLRNFEKRFHNSSTIFITKTDLNYGSFKNARIIENLQPKKLEVNLNRSKSSDLLFIGHIDYEPNLMGLLTICQWLQEENFSGKLVAVGSYNRNSKILLLKYNFVELRGYVQDLNTVGSNFIFGLCYTPIATGVQNKVFQYLTRGIPVVCSRNLKDVFADLANKGVFFIENKEELVSITNILLDKRY